ncbi:MAG: serpin family protein [Acutalibacteraceae bacterium]|nr:serpin family protein [Acutalibacteraceae bacterium]
MKNKFLYKSIAVALSAGALIVGLCGCGEKELPDRADNANDLLASVQKSDTAPAYDFKAETEKPESYDNYISKNGALALDLLRGEDYANKNTAVAPVGVTLSLSALENGASGETLKQVKKMLGKSTYSTEIINECASYLTQRMSFFNTEELGVYNVNSMWVTNTNAPKRGFLQKYDNYYNIFAYRADFADAKTPTLISNLIKDNSMSLIPTDGIAVKSDYKLYLDSSVAVSDSWLYGYEDAKVSQGKFTASDGKSVDVSYLTSVERSFSVQYAKGFIKDLKNTPCKLLCVMPNEDVTLEKYVGDLTTENLLDLARSASPTSFTTVSMPEFSVNNSTSIKDTLMSMGINDIFTSKADFSKAFAEDIFVDDFTQNVTITVNKNGISTNIVQEDIAKNNQKTKATLKLDRPFLYAVIDNESNAPIIIGTVNNPSNK